MLWEFQLNFANLNICRGGGIGRRTGYKIRKRFCIPEGNSYNLSSARVVKLVDTGDSKSPASNGVPVRVRPLVPSSFPF